MRFLIDEDLPRSTGELLRSHGHEATDVRDVGLRGARDSEIAVYAKKEGLTLLTGDFDFSDIRNYPPSQYAGIVVVNPNPQNATAQAILGLLESFLAHKNLLAKLSGKLAVVRPEHIRIRGNQ